MTSIDSTKVAELLRAFERFSCETQRLEEAYQHLQVRYRAVNDQLEKKVKELNTTTHYLSSLLGSMRQGILFINREGLILTFNTAAENILGIPKELTQERLVWDSFEDMDFGFSMRSALTKGDTPANSYCRFERPDGSERELEIDITTADPETAGGLILLLRDVTELKRLQRITSRRDRLGELGEMAASVAHAIRNPLGGIRGYAGLLERDLSEMPHLQKMAHSISEGATALDHLVSQVLTYTRPVEPTLASTKARDLLEEVRALVTADSHLSQGISVHLSTEDDLTLFIDRELMKSALLNLIVNAIHAMPSGGVVSLTATAKNGESLLSVADKGIGIPPENLERVFSPFFTTKTRGNGLGLSEVHKTVQAHGGTIEVVSDMGKGTTFTIRLK